MILLQIASRLSQAVDILSGQENGELDDLLKEGLIQRFEYTHELAWKVMKDYAEYQGYSDIRGSRDAIRKALEINLIFDRRWMESVEDRNLTSLRVRFSPINVISTSEKGLKVPLALEP